MSLIIHLPVGVVAAILTTIEYFFSTIAALSARATLHGVWLLGLHRGGEAALDARSRTRRALRKDFVSFILTVVLVVATAGVETSLRPTWLLEPYAVNSTFCVSTFGRVLPFRVESHSPPFRVTVEPWVIRSAEQLQCTNGIASVGTGSWTALSGLKMDMTGPTCVNSSIELGSGLIATKIKKYKFDAKTFNPKIGESPSYTFFPLNGANIGKNIENIGTQSEGEGHCGDRGISSYHMGMNARYESTRIYGLNMTFAVHESLCKAHGSRAVNPLGMPQVQRCLRGVKLLNISCVLGYTNSQQRYSVRLPNIAALYVSDSITSPSYACVTSTVQVEYLFVESEIAVWLMPPEEPQQTNNSNPNQAIRPRLPVLVPTAVKAISGTCERTIAPLAQSALFFSLEQEWRNMAFAMVDRQVRFHAFMMAVSETLFPLANLKTPESSFFNGTCYVRPTSEVTEIPWSPQSIFLLSWMILVVLVILSACIFRIFFRGESWLVGSARWSLTRLLGDGGDKGQQTKETLIEAVPIPAEPADQISRERTVNGFTWGGRFSRGNATAEPRSDWKYEYRVRTKDRGQGSSP